QNKSPQPMSSLAQFEELKARAESCLATSGSVQKVRPFITAMAETAVPVSTRYQHIPAENIIKENIAGKNQKEVRDSLTQLIKALNILVKYGCNLTNPNRPQYWRTVKYNNPVFKTVVDIIKGGRNVLCLYGYTNKMPDGLNFPDDVTSPDVQKVAEVATEVMTLSAELDLFTKLDPCSSLFTKNINLCNPLPSKDDVMSITKSQASFKILDIKKQDTFRKEGLKLLHHLKEGEKKGFGPEEVYAALQASGGSGVWDWLHSELPHVLEEICAMILLSKAEAKQAWITSEGNTQKAVLQLLSDRAAKLHVLMSMGFVDRLACEKALFISAGDLGGALSHLQRPLLQPLHNNIWKEQTNIHFDINHDDKEWLCCRLLGLYNLPSWGRCLLALSLLQQPDVEYSLEDVVQCVREHHDKDFINRILKKECKICFGSFPQRKMHSLTACQCSMCTECFKQHFTVVLRDKHIRDMVCPVCEEPDINDPETFLTYVSTLDVQLRVYLEPETYELFGKKLMEHAVMKDPKFLWCCHCTNGFINDKDQLKVTCQNCQQSFCSKCKKPWEDQHEGISCNDFQAWKRENDSDYQKQGLAGFLHDNGINCPNCKFQYALAKGGCMHFTCSQCRYEFCCGCNNPFHKRGCMYAQCTVTGLHAHHPRDCLFYLRDWTPARLQALLQVQKRRQMLFTYCCFNSRVCHTEGCGVMEQKDGAQFDAPCGIQTQEGHAGLCDKHYREYLVSLINAHLLDPADFFEEGELISACKRHKVYHDRGEEENDETYHTRLRQKLKEIPLGDKVPRKI
uniref:RBR-type E3 ubiquitin transferase n=1 Tax=Electrophorus electricus TaxID=8005 RepID=A0A4W4GZP1_ELEEL